MKKRKFMIGLATISVATPLVAMMSGCTQYTTSNIAKLNKTNNRITNGHTLTVYVDGDHKLGEFTDVLPSEWGDELRIQIPNEIINHGKVLDTSSEAKGYWGYTENPIKTPLRIVSENEFVIELSDEDNPAPLNVYLPLSNKDDNSNISNCSWSDFLYWYDKCKTSDSEHDLKSFKAIFDLPVEEDSLVGVERTVNWAGLDHKVRIVDTDEDFEGHSTVCYAPEDGQELCDISDTPYEYGEADLVFQFANVLTKATKDGNQIWKTQWHSNDTPDANMNCWAVTFNHPPHDPDVWEIFSPSKLRSHLREKKNFLDKFADQALLDAIRPVYINRFGSMKDPTDAASGHRNWFKEKFFIATGHQMGLPEKGEPGAPNFEYYIENDVDTFAYWVQHPNKEDRQIYRVGRGPGEKTEQYWVCSPCNTGSGVGHVENVIYVDFDGSWARKSMNHEKDILPCFCL